MPRLPVPWRSSSSASADISRQGWCDLVTCLELIAETDVQEGKSVKHIVGRTNEVVGPLLGQLRWTLLLTTCRYRLSSRRSASSGAAFEMARNVE
jgi:hypothetical protein